MPPKPKNKPESPPAEPAEATEAAEASAEGAPAAEAAAGDEAPAAEAPAAAEPAAEAVSAPPAEEAPAPAPAPPVEAPPVGTNLDGVRVRVLFTERKADQARALRDRLSGVGANAFLVDVTDLPAVDRHANTAYVHPKAQSIAAALAAELGGVRLRAQAEPGEDHVFVWIV